MERKEKQFYIGVDIGKTKIAAGLLNSLGDLLLRIEDSSAGCDAEEIINKCKSMIVKILNQSLNAPLGIGIGASGVINCSEGIIVSSGAIPGWRNIKICEMFEEEFGIKTKIDNDVNVAAICEHRFGAGINNNSSVYISVGTGIGICSILENKIHRGKHNISGQVAYLKLFGLNNTVNEICSGRGIANRASKNKDFVTSEVFERARNQDLEAVEIIADAINGIAALSMWMQNTIDPDIIILGGGIIMKNNDFFESIKDMVDSSYFSNYLDALGGQLNLKKAKYGLDAGIIGAGCLCF